MMENYVYPDTHEMFDLHDTLEELISKESYDIGLGLGSRVDSDPDLEYLLEVLFTPVESPLLISGYLGKQEVSRYHH